MGLENRGVGQIAMGIQVDNEIKWMAIWKQQNEERRLREEQDAMLYESRRSLRHRRKQRDTKESDARHRRSLPSIPSGRPRHSSKASVSSTPSLLTAVGDAVVSRSATPSSR